VAEHGVVVERHLGVERDQLAALGHHQRVDLREAAIALDEHAAESLHEFLGRADADALEPQQIRQFARLIGEQPQVRIELLFEDQLGGFLGDFLDVHAAFARHHQHRTGRSAIDDDAEIEFAGDFTAFFDEHLMNDLAGRASLDRFQVVAEQICRDLLGFLGTLDELYAALFAMLFDRALAAAARVNLGLDHGDLAAELGKGGSGFIGGAGDDAARHRHTRLAKDFLRLEFMDFHAICFASGESDRGWRRPGAW
jgi:hypothetical protein